MLSEYISKRVNTNIKAEFHTSFIYDISVVIKMTQTIYAMHKVSNCTGTVVSHESTCMTREVVLLIITRVI